MNSAVCFSFNAEAKVPFRIFHGGDLQTAPPIGPSLDWTVRRFVDDFVLPNYLKAKKRQPGTIKLYYEVVRLWEEMTPNPSLGLIEQNPEICQRWVEALQLRPGLKSETISDNTLRRLCIHFQKILDLAGSKNRRNRNAAALMIDVPYLERPDAVRNPPDGDFSLKEIGMWLGACHLAKRTENHCGQNPCRFAKALILFAYNSALRIDTIMSARWEMIGKSKKGPNWIVIPNAIYKGRRHGGEFYLNSRARAAIESVRVRGNDLLFPWKGWPDSQSWFQEQRRRLLATTEIPESRRFGYHGLRKACITWLASKNPMVAKIVGGHRGGVTQDFYVNPKIVEDLLEELPQPRVDQPMLF
jgi:integrase